MLLKRSSVLCADLCFSYWGLCHVHDAGESNLALTFLLEPLTVSPVRLDHAEILAAGYVSGPCEGASHFSLGTLPTDSFQPAG